MIIYIDESGEPGFKESSPTKYFVMSLLIFDNSIYANNCRDKLKRLKCNLGFNTEFKFSKSSTNTRDAFFDIIKNDIFRVRAIVVKKELIYSNYLKNNSDNFYNFILKQLITNTDNIEDPTIIIDGKRNRKFTTEIKSYLRRNNDLNIKKLKFQDSKTDILLQMSDMVASCIGYSYNRQNKKNAKKWREFISNKTNIWEFH